MLKDILANPAVSILFGIIITAIGGLIVSAVNRRNKENERKTQEAALAIQQQTQSAALAMQKAELQGQLDKLRLENELVKEKRETDEELRQEAAREESARLEAAMIATAKSQSDKTDAQDLIMAQIHRDTNSAVTAMKEVESDLRAKIEKIETAAVTAATMAATAMQVAKDMASRDMESAKEKIAALELSLAVANEKIAALSLALAVANEQIAALTRQLATTPLPLPPLVTGTQDTTPAPISGAQAVTVPEMVLPVEAAQEKPLILKPGDA